MSHFIRVPPDSTGKRVISQRTARIGYISGSSAFNVDDVIIGGTSNVSAVVYEVEGSVSTGNVYVSFDDLQENIFTIPESLNVGGNTFATSSTVTEFWAQKTLAVDADNPTFGQRIDARGANHIRFFEGNPQLDAFNNLKVSENIIIGFYHHVYDDFIGNGSLDYHSLTGGTASATRDEDRRSLILQVGTANADVSTITTNKYFTYFSGSSPTMVVSLYVGDTGKANVVREWGYFDDDDGLFFRLDDTTLSVVARSSTTGSVVETVINQENWNSDTLDGSGGRKNISRMNIDVSKSNIYWIDFQWLGAGRARLGVFSPSGERVPVHTFNNANTNIGPYMRSGTLPIRYSIYNTAGSGSPSEMGITCAAMYTNLTKNNVDQLYSHLKAQDMIVTSDIGSETLITAMRANVEVYGQTNRILSIPTTISGYANVATIFRLYEDSTTTSGSWSTVNGANDALEFNSTANLDVSGTEVWSKIVNGELHVDLTDESVFGFTVDSICLQANAALGREYVLTAEPLAGNANVWSSVHWVEYK